MVHITVDGTLYFTLQFWIFLLLFYILRVLILTVSTCFDVSTYLIVVSNENLLSSRTPCERVRPVKYAIMHYCVPKGMRTGEITRT